MMSDYGKLFERLVLGSVLSTLGFERVTSPGAQGSVRRKTEKVFWLSDSSENRESDATLLLSLGKLARFDIGFIGPGNSEISKDKLSRFARQIEVEGRSHNSTTFIVVDRLPRTGKTEDAARAIGAEIIQMSMQYWPRLLAQRLGARLGYRHELQAVADEQMGRYLAEKLAPVAIQDFLIGVSSQDLESDAELPSAEEEMEDVL